MMVFDLYEDLRIHPEEQDEHREGQTEAYRNYMPAPDLPLQKVCTEKVCRENEL